MMFKGYYMEIIKEIERLKKERNAVILAHNYQIPEVQDIADYVGDSLGLSIQASKTKAGVIVSAAFISWRKRRRYYRRRRKCCCLIPHPAVRWRI